MRNESLPEFSSAERKAASVGKSTSSRNLLELPNELLLHIIDHLECTPYIFSHRITNLLVNKRWFELATPAFYRTISINFWPLGTSDLQNFPSPGTRLHNHIASKTTSLHIRFEGPWGEYLSQEHRPADDFVLPKEKVVLFEWIDKTNRALSRFGEGLPSLKNLEDLTLEASAQDVRDYGPRWDYIFRPTIQVFLNGAANHAQLTSLTLDCCGSALIEDSNRRDRVPGPANIDSEHICPLIARLLPQLKKLRLRLRELCPDIFNDVAINRIVCPNLETVIVKLSQPYFSQSPWNYSLFATAPCNSMACSELVVPRSVYRLLRDVGPLPHALFQSARACLPYMPRISKFDISVAGPEVFPGLLAIDCITATVPLNPDDGFAQDDSGASWWWEEDSRAPTDFDPPYEDTFA